MIPFPTLFGTRPNPLRSALPVAAAAAAALLGLSAAHAGPDDDKTVLCFVSHKTSHGFGAHEYAAGCRLIGKWLEESYPNQNIESRYSINWPAEPETFFKTPKSERAKDFLGKILSH